MEAVDQWTSFFEEVARLLHELNRQYGVGNHSYTDYAIERLGVCISSIRSLNRAFNSSPGALGNDLDELVSHLTTIRAQWLGYKEVLSSLGDANHLAYQVQQSSTHQRGRPSFIVSQDEIEYLLWMSFSWSEIASLLGISRSTLYRSVK